MDDVRIIRWDWKASKWEGKSGCVCKYVYSEGKRRSLSSEQAIIGTWEIGESQSHETLTRRKMLKSGIKGNLRGE